MLAVDESVRVPLADLVFPHIVDGAGYTTQFVVFNRSAVQSFSGNLRFFSQSGRSFSVWLKSTLSEY
jgi:hypothetical protein